MQNFQNQPNKIQLTKDCKPYSKRQMKTHTLSDVTKTIQCIIEQGANTLYHQYLNQKMPQHLAINLVSTISQVFDPSLLPFDQRSDVKHDNIVKSIKKENRLLNKIKIGGFQRPKSQLSNQFFQSNNNTTKKKESQQYDPYKMTYSLKVKRSNKEENPQQQQAESNKKIVPTIRASFPINYCDQVQSGEIQNSRKLKKQLYERNNMKKIVQLQIERKKKEFINKRKKLEQQYQQLNIKGIPYTYNYQGSEPIAIGDLKRGFNQNLQANSKSKKQKPNFKLSSLKYQNVQYETVGSNPIQQTLQGKRKSIYTNRIRRKPICSEEQYNNNDKRQFSTIPFVDLNEGIKLIQTSKNMVAERRKAQTVSRQQFRTSKNRKKFKLYLPEKLENFSSPLESTTAIYDNNDSRPNTVGQLTTGKQTAETGISKRSILWRPNTTTREGRVKINKNLIDQFIQ